MRAFLRDSRGTVLMESILVLPLLLMLITGIFQFSRFWQARLLTRYAAYNAARVALVYNPVHYRIPADDPGPDAGKFFADKGVCWLAAVGTLAWMSATPNTANYWLPGYGWIPNSSGIPGQVRIVPEGCKEDNGWVMVTVAFDYPTLFAVFDATAVNSSDGHGTEADISEVTDWSAHPHFTFVESCLLPKPWTTERYPHLSPEEADVLRTNIGGGA
ncbi:MAG: pilus assembly protein [Kiritimatiellae bacterium]|nr:pilus assembly protein [Kiritimatiellia bacterium]